MKKWISVALATFCTVSFAEAMTLEEYDKVISEATNPTIKQVVICERESNFIYKDSQQCIKAIDMLLEMSKRTTKNSLLRCELYGVSEKVCKLNPTVYQKTDKEIFNGLIANSYLGAGDIYRKNEMNKESFAMFKKTIEYEPNHIGANNIVGTGYYFGQGVAMNKIKAYEHWSIAAKQDDQEAQKNLDILCGESPWACK